MLQNSAWLFFMIFCLVSCTAPDGRVVSQPVSANVKARLRQPLPVVLMGLQDQVALQRPAQHGDVWRQAAGDSGEVLNGLSEAGAGMGQGAVVLLPFFALALVAPPLQMLASGNTVSAEKAEGAAQKMHAGAARRNWGDFVRRTVQQQWAARGAAFSSVRSYHPASPSAGPDPLSAEGRANVSGRTLLFVHVAGPALTAEGKKLNPSIGPSLMLHWKVVDMAGGAVLARGTIAERSPLRKTLLQWADRGDAGLVTEMEKVIRQAAARLAAELR